MSSNFIIDTNFVLRYLLLDNDHQSREAQRFFEEVKAGSVKAILEQSVFTEIIFVLSSVYRVPRGEIALIIGNFLLYKGIVLQSKDAILKALEIFIHSSLHIVDCLVIAKSIVENYEIKSFDKELLKCSNKLFRHNL